MMGDHRNASADSRFHIETGTQSLVIRHRGPAFVHRLAAQPVPVPAQPETFQDVPRPAGSEPRALRPGPPSTWRRCSLSAGTLCGGDGRGGPRWQVPASVGARRAGTSQPCSRQAAAVLRRAGRRRRCWTVGCACRTPGGRTDSRPAAAPHRHHRRVGRGHGGRLRSATD
ncbi:hypothetical protein QJS66_01120 [Kocuria rhizophila]|nr:hypothetical protein QJS66_01120 [Kocuria rhizophila]